MKEKLIQAFVMVDSNLLLEIDSYATKKALSRSNAMRNILKDKFYGLPTQEKRHNYYNDKNGILRKRNEKIIKRNKYYN